MADITITTLEGLRQHLQSALVLEHATIPPYLSALYSIKPDSNPESLDVIRSVLIEEMLHLALAANLLNAVGGSPVLDEPDFIATYPTPLPNSDNKFVVPIVHFSPAAIETFMRVEKPEEPDARSEADEWETIGQFYRALEEGFEYLCTALGEDQVFCGDPTRQITPEALGFRTGKVIAVRNYQTALAAIDEIEEQGEGLKHAEVWDGDRDMFHPEREEVAHYFRFSQITQGRLYQRGDTPQSGPSGDAFEVDWDSVYPMRDNPRVDDYLEGSVEREKMLEFNALYCEMLRTLQLAFNGQPERLNDAISEMMELRDRVHELMQMPSGDGETTLGPSFEYVARPDRKSDQVRHIAISVRENGPYVVEGPLTLRRKSVVYSEHGEPLTWRKGEVVPTDSAYRLCRCGQSSNKPFCDGTHATVGFDGTETAATQPSGERRERIVATNITLTDDHSLCIHAGFCSNRVEGVWDMVERTDDSQVRFQMMQMVEQCPSGRLLYELEDGALEPDLPIEIAATRDGPYWVTGEVEVRMSDGRELEVRNRVTLCRCGHSANKPLCDGSHKQVGFQDG